MFWAYLNIYSFNTDSFHCLNFLICGNNIPERYIQIRNILLSQGSSYPDLSSPLASAELAPPSISLDGAQAVVGDENEDEEEDKMEVVTLQQLS